MKNQKGTGLSREQLKEVKAIVGFIKLIQKVGGAFEGFRIILIPTHGKPFVAQSSRTERGEELLEAVTAQSVRPPYSFGTHLHEGKRNQDEDQES
ncbi:MAG: hypothetical protein EB101_09975 [Chitinophagia bacterium]|nr:hypothetical protein [Chitinophagia bacterium]